MPTYVVAVMQSLTPPQLAGVLGAILTSENISKPQVWVAYEPTAQVVDAVQALEPERERLYKVQVQHGVQAPLAIDLRLAGISFCSCMQIQSLSKAGVVSWNEAKPLSYAPARDAKRQAACSRRQKRSVLLVDYGTGYHIGQSVLLPKSVCMQCYFAARRQFATGC